MTTPGQPSHAGQVPYFRFVNNSGQIIPSFALMEVEPGQNATQENPTKVRKPSGPSLTNVLVNGPTPVPPGEEGEAQLGQNIIIRRDERDAVPEPGDQVGSHPDSWCARPNQVGFTIRNKIDSVMPYMNVERYCQPCVPPSTTTTDSPCTGTGKWVFNTLSRVWVNTENNCSPGCLPYPPQFCPPEDAECAVYISQCGVHDLQPVTCNICTTTTGDPLTTTTTPDPMTTTTTTVSPCAGCCKQEYIGGQWVTVFNNCVSPCFCDIGTAQNPYPSNPGPCTTITGGATGGGGGPGGPYCVGNCKFICSANLDWVYVSGSCLTNGVVSCYCELPSGPCDICNTVAFTPCHFPVTSTTPDPATTTTTGDPLTTTTSTSTTCSPTTTTTPPPGVCTGICVWKRNEDNTAFEFVYTTCTGCFCDNPNTTTTTPDPGTTTTTGDPGTTTTTTTTTTWDPCAYIETPCGDPNTTTTTAGPTTTGDPGTTTTTTTTPEPCGTCSVYIGFDEGGACIDMTQPVIPCEGGDDQGCICQAFLIYPICTEAEGSVVQQFLCSDPGNVTTTSTTTPAPTTTTTSTTTCDPCAGSCSVEIVPAGGGWNVVTSVEACENTPNGCACGCYICLQYTGGVVYTLPGSMYPDFVQGPGSFSGTCGNLDNIPAPCEPDTTTTTTTTTTTANPCAGDECTYTTMKFVVSEISPCGGEDCCCYESSEMAQVIQIGQTIGGVPDPFGNWTFSGYCGPCPPPS